MTTPISRPSGDFLADLPARSAGSWRAQADRAGDRGAGEDRITFTPSILSRYLRKTKSVAELGCIRPSRSARR